MADVVWMPALCCPVCRTPLCERDVVTCGCCGGTYSRSDGVLRLLSPAGAETAAPFLAQYRAVRHADGHAGRSHAEYASLPSVPKGDPATDEWRIRRQSYNTVCRVLRRFRRTGLRILDVGAGDAWLSNRLSLAGHRPVAVDIDGGHDGLLACPGFGARFPLVQADFDALPLAPAQFDVVVLNASLHYAADPVQTLFESSRLLAAGGALAVMDSPMFTREEDGEAMVARQLEHLRSQYGIARPIRAGRGFLTYTMLQHVANTLGRRARFTASRGSLAWRLRRTVARVRLGRSPAAFGVWVTQ